MSEISSFRSVIRLWRSAAEMAAEIGAPVRGAQKWLERDSIPPAWWPCLLRSPRVKKAGITLDHFDLLRARRNGAATIWR